MDTFRLLKFWKTHGGVFPVHACSNTPRATITSTIPTTVVRHHPSSSSSTDTSPDNNNHDDDHKTIKHESIDLFRTNRTKADDDGKSDGEKSKRDEFLRFTEPIDLYFKSNEQSRMSAVNSAMKLRAMMLKLKKSKGNNEIEKMEFDDDSVSVMAAGNNQKKQRKLLKVEEEVRPKSEKQRISAESGPNHENRFSTDLVQKYLKRVKPMYIRVSNRYSNEKKELRRVNSTRETRSGQSPPSKKKSTGEKRQSRQREMTEAPPAPAGPKNWKRGNNLPARLRVVRSNSNKHTGKGRSAASSGLTPENRRDDSVFEKEDGIQSAILHCKRSFNGSRGI